MTGGRRDLSKTGQPNTCPHLVDRRAEIDHWIGGARNHCLWEGEARLNKTQSRIHKWVNNKEKFLRKIWEASFLTICRNFGKQDESTRSWEAREKHKRGIHSSSTPAETAVWTGANTNSRTNTQHLRSKILKERRNVMCVRDSWRHETYTGLNESLTGLVLARHAKEWMTRWMYLMDRMTSSVWRRTSLWKLLKLRKTMYYAEQYTIQDPTEKSASSLVWSMAQTVGMPFF